MKKKLTITLFLVLCCSIINGQANLQYESELKIKKIFGEEVLVSFSKIDLISAGKQMSEKKAGDRFYSSYLFRWIINKNDRHIGTAYLDNTKGKMQPISFLVVLDSISRISNVEIVKYRESHGGQVREKNWLSQFIGKDENSGYKVGKDINSISGATISTHSVSKAVERIMLLDKHLRGQK
jgi:Na+-translocating ferredoxin:NAD+ oxidoreductase RnfG subunit